MGRQQFLVCKITLRCRFLTKGTSAVLPKQLNSSRVSLRPAFRFLSYPHQHRCSEGFTMLIMNTNYDFYGLISPHANFCNNWTIITSLSGKNSQVAKRKKNSPFFLCINDLLLCFFFFFENGHSIRSFKLLCCFRV